MRDRGISSPVKPFPGISQGHLRPTYRYTMGGTIDEG